MARSRLRRFGALLCVAGVLLARANAHAQDVPPWPDTFLARVQALALIQTLNADILGSRSATSSLETWCRDHRLAADPTIVARAVAGVSRAATGETRQRLEVGPADEIKYRRVELRCGGRVLSKAGNWYVPGRLTREGNQMTETTQTPVGQVAESRLTYLRTFAVNLLWSPLPRGWEQTSTWPDDARGRTLAIPAAVFEHRAVLYTREHRPFSEVDEVYQRDVLAFSPPPAR